MGRDSGRWNTTGHNNIAIGYYSGRQTSGSYNISIGYNAGPTSSGVGSSDKLYIDRSRLGSSSLIYGDMSSSRSVTINGSLSVTGTLSASSGGTITADVTGSLIGTSNKSISIPSINQISATSSSTTSMYLGYQSAYDGVRNGGSFNTFYGYQSGKNSQSSCDNNTYIGYQAGLNATTGETNTAIGQGALRSNQSGDRNVALGFYSGIYVTGDRNLCLGYNAGPTGTTASDNKVYIDPNQRNGINSLIYGDAPAVESGNYSTRLIQINANFKVRTGRSAVSSGWTTYSDISFKRDIIKLDGCISDKINLLNPVTYTLKLDNKKDVGFIAQEVQEIFPLLVIKDKDGTLTMDYSKLTAYIVKCQQENNNKIKELESKIDEEKDKRESMEKFFKEEIEKLRKEILRK